MGEKYIYERQYDDNYLYRKYIATDNNWRKMYKIVKRNRKSLLRDHHKDIISEEYENEHDYYVIGDACYRDLKTGRLEPIMGLYAILVSEQISYERGDEFRFAALYHESEQGKNRTLLQLDYMEYAYPKACELAKKRDKKRKAYRWKKFKSFFS